METHNQESSGLGEDRNTSCFLSGYMLYTHAFCICFYSIMLFITLFFRCVMKYERRGWCGENEGRAPLGFRRGLGGDEVFKKGGEKKINEIYSADSDISDSVGSVQHTCDGSRMSG